MNCEVNRLYKDQFTNYTGNIQINHLRHLDLALAIAPALALALALALAHKLHFSLPIFGLPIER